MRTSLEEMVRQAQPEPRLLVAMRGTGLFVLILALLSLLVGVVGLFFGFGDVVWVYAFFASLAASGFLSFLTSRWTENLFVRRAKALGVAQSEARTFWRAYCWNKINA